MDTLDFEPLTFGKYKGQTPAEVAEFDPNYIIWLYDNVQPRPCTRALYEDCEITLYDEEAEYDLDLHYSIDGWGEME